MREVSIYNYYDYGYAVRYSNSSVTSSAYITNCQNYINTVFHNLFDINVYNANSPSQIKSYADRCTMDYGGTVTSTNINSLCQHAANTRCNNSLFPNHHTCHAQNLHDIVERFDNGNGAYLVSLITGHKVCGIDSSNVHGTPSQGMAIYSSSVTSVTEPDDTDTSKARQRINLCVMLHEQSHNLGAGGAADTEHGQCIMSYDKNREQCRTQIINGDYSQIYCSACRAAIQNKINNNY